MTPERERMKVADHVDSSDEEGERYEKTRKIGEGTYAVIFDARDKQTGQRVVVKKIKVQRQHEGLDVAAIREISALKELSHPNILHLMDVYTSASNIHLVLEHLEADLEMLIKDQSLTFSAADIKSWMKMLFSGLAHCHANHIIHRDIKPNNLLLGADGVLRLADFGLARETPVLPTDPTMTPNQVTLWYRPPELLFGATMYSYAVDVWSAGCVFAELMIRHPYLPGSSTLDQLETIFKALGTPDEMSWPGVKALPAYVEFRKWVPGPLRDLFSAASVEALDVLGLCLKLDPNKRPTCMQVLKHAYFRKGVKLTPPSQLPRKSKVEDARMTRMAGVKRRWEEDNEGMSENSGGVEPVARRLKFV